MAIKRDKTPTTPAVEPEVKIPEANPMEKPSLKDLIAADQRNRVEAMTREFNELMQKHRVRPVVETVHRNGALASLSIGFEPTPEV